MSQPYVGEIRCLAFSFAPAGWALCNGQLLDISTYETLFNLIGTTYGGDGQSTFRLPDLQGRAPMHIGSGPGLTTVIGQPTGQPYVTLTANQIPQHNHPVVAANIEPGGAGEHAATPTLTAFLGPSNPDALYLSSPTVNTAFAGQTISANGGSQPHDNMQPYLTLNFCISLYGIFPSQT